MSIFSCMTGLCISDVLKLDWKDILPTSNGSYCMRLRTEKAETETTLSVSHEVNPKFYYSLFLINFIIDFILQP